jgi:hypothetical protein
MINLLVHSILALVVVKRDLGSTSLRKKQAESEQKPNSAKFFKS